MRFVTYIAWIPILPLVSFVLLGLWGKKYFKNFSGIIGTVVLFAITIFSLIIAYEYYFVGGKVNGVYQPIIALQFEWLRFSPAVSISMGIVLDPISVMMLVVVTV